MGHGNTREHVSSFPPHPCAYRVFNFCTFSDIIFILAAQCLGKAFYHEWRSRLHFYVCFSSMVKVNAMHSTFLSLVGKSLAAALLTEFN